MGLGKEDTSALDATLEGSKDNDVASLEEEEDTGDEQIRGNNIGGCRSMHNK